MAFASVVASSAVMDARHYTIARTLPFPREAVFDLVADVESYPRFVPGWREVRVLRREQQLLEVEQAVGLGPLELRFHSTATLERPARIAIRSGEPPFADLVLEWRFADAPAGGCQVTLRVECRFRARRMQLLADALLARFGERTLRAVEQRAYARLAPDA